jgi:hypothetical protein
MGGQELSMHAGLELLCDGGISELALNNGAPMQGPRAWPILLQFRSSGGQPGLPVSCTPRLLSWHSCRCMSGINECVSPTVRVHDRAAQNVQREHDL